MALHDPAEDKISKNKPKKKKQNKFLTAGVEILKSIAERNPGRSASKGKDTQKKKGKSGLLKLTESVVGIVGDRSRKRDAERKNRLFKAKPTDSAFKRRKGKLGARQGFAP